ncbi:hypothetical protein BB558_003785, partial [Smittium angustum]
LAPFKKNLLKDVKGNVLEIGPTYGTAMKYFNIPEVTKYTCIEPNNYFYEGLKKEGMKNGFSVSFIKNDSPPVPEAQLGLKGEIKNMMILNGSISTESEIQKTIMENGPYDSIVSMFVLCSVNNEKETIKAIKKLLKPGGKFFFMEHVAQKRTDMLKDNAVHYFQRIVSPLWNTLLGNCHIHRHTDVSINSFRWKSVKMDKTGIVKGLGVSYLAPIVYGVAENN